MCNVDFSEMAEFVRFDGDALTEFLTQDIRNERQISPFFSFCYESGAQLADMYEPTDYEAILESIERVQELFGLALQLAFHRHFYDGHDIKRCSLNEFLIMCQKWYRNVPTANAFVVGRLNELYNGLKERAADRSQKWSWTLRH